jgi:hypothetical protein
LARNYQSYKKAQQDTSAAMDRFHKTGGAIVRFPVLQRLHAVLREFIYSLPVKWIRDLILTIYRYAIGILQVPKKLGRESRYHGSRGWSQEKYLHHLRKFVPKNNETLKQEHAGTPLDKTEDTVILYRIIGNDLYPRHEYGQSRKNVQFILENEPELEGCQKRWILNRIVNLEERAALKALLDSYGQHYTEISFSQKEWCGIDWDFSTFPSPGLLSRPAVFSPGNEQLQRAYTAVYRKKNNYVMHNNGARNIALEDGRKHAKWVLPWDGNCFVTPEAWKQIRQNVVQNRHLKYFIVPMQRVPDNSALLNNSLTVLPLEEPQIIFRKDADARFNKDHPYGRRPKVELLKFLGVPGIWDGWRDDPWEQKSRAPGRDAGVFRAAGWVARLASGVSVLEKSEKEALIGRGVARQEGITSTLNYLTRSFCADWACAGFNTLKPASLESLSESTRSAIIENAEQALRRKPESVVDKLELPPSGDSHDYYHPAPYWWPNPRRKRGLPYIRNDGQRVPGTQMYEASSEKYDRTRLQYLFDDSFSLALAFKLTGSTAYAEQAAEWFRRWFVRPETRMNPHLKYAQVRWGWDDNQGQARGIIEAKDFYYYLDAVRLLEQGAILDQEDLAVFRGWLTEYLDWLTASPQGQGEVSAANNHGTYYDLQVAAIANYLGDDTNLYRTLIRARDRIGVQYSPEGVPYHEMSRTQTAHYSCYNLQGWLNLAELARRSGDRLTHYSTPEGAGLQNAINWLLAHYGHPWPYEQIEAFDADRFVPIIASTLSLGLRVSVEVENNVLAVTAQKKPCFHPHDGVRPYWAIDLVRSEAV